MAEKVTEKQIEAYRHYMKIKAEDLIAEYVSAKFRDSREVTAPMRVAVEDRIEEVEEVLLDVRREAEAEGSRATSDERCDF